MKLMRKRLFLILLVLFCDQTLFHEGLAVNASSIDSRPIADTSIYSGAETTPASGSYYIALGYDTMQNPEYKGMQAIFRFMLPEGLNETQKIDKAILWLYLTPQFTTPGASSIDVTIQQLTMPWTETDIPPLTWQSLDRTTIIVSPTVSLQLTSTVGFHQFDLKPLLENWVANKRGNQFGIILSSTVQDTENKRSFYSRNCSDTLCGLVGSVDDKRPKLSIEHSLLPPTPIPPTPTPTPTPGISFLTLRADPTGEIQRGQEITYSIGYQNGGYALSNVKIENVIPTQLVLITDSFSYSGQIPGTPTIVDNNITWNVASTLPISASGSVSYRAARPTLMPTNTVTVTPPLTDTPTGTITLTPTNTEVSAPTITHTPTSTNTPTNTPTATNPPTGTVSATSTPIPTVPTSQVAVNVVAIPNDPQNFEFVGSLGSFTLDDAIPDDLDSITKGKTFDWKNSNVPIVITQKTLISWTLYSVVCYPPGNTSLQAAAQNSTLTLDAGILATNENLYCVFINVRNDYLGSPASQATANALIRSVSVGLQGTPVPTAVPTVEALEPIINEGATIHWEYQATPDALLSNSTLNPSIQIYLPIIAR